MKSLLFSLTSVLLLLNSISHFSSAQELRNVSDLAMLSTAQSQNYDLNNPMLLVGPGCTNSLACNYDPTATIDDGSCILPEPIIEWQNTIGGSAGDYLRSMVQTTDGGYILGYQLSIRVL